MLEDSLPHPLPRSSISDLVAIWVNYSQSVTPTNPLRFTDQTNKKPRFPEFQFLAQISAPLDA